MMHILAIFTAQLFSLEAWTQQETGGWDASLKGFEMFQKLTSG